VKYEPGEYCILLYKLDEQMVVGHIRWEAGATVLPASDYQIASLGMAVYPYSQDPWLPGLAAASDPQVIAEALSKALPECQSGQARVLQVRASPQRYRPGKRLTLRLDVRLRDLNRGDITSRTYYAKVYHDSKKANSVYHEMQMMADLPPAREGKVVLARAAVFLPDLSMVLQEPVSGTPLEDLIGRMEGSARTGDPRGWSGMQRAAAALAAVHTAGVVTKRQRPIRDELARFQKRAAKIESVDAAQGRRMGELAAALPAWLGWLDEWGAELSLIHGDCKPSQFLIGEDHVAILDFDHAGMADPANDVGTFLATLRQLALRQSLKAKGDAPSTARTEWLLALEKRFLDDYCTASDRGEGFRLRATWYEAVGLMRKALRGFGRSPFSPLPDAMVAEAWNCLRSIE
jgi:aminoglycoside phosphotransferase (APT) family kinase protein